MGPRTLAKEVFTLQNIAYTFITVGARVSYQEVQSCRRITRGWLTRLFGRRWRLPTLTAVGLWW